jgi:hypothetical protein
MQPMLVLAVLLAATVSGAPGKAGIVEPAPNLAAVKINAIESTVRIEVPDHFAPVGAGVMMRRPRQLLCELVTVRGVSLSSELLNVTTSDGIVHTAAIEYSDESRQIDVYLLNMVAKDPACPTVTISKNSPPDGTKVLSLSIAPGQKPEVVSGQIDSHALAGDLELGNHSREMIVVNAMPTVRTDRGSGIFNEQGELVGLNARDLSHSSIKGETSQNLQTVLEQMDSLRRHKL